MEVQRVDEGLWRWAAPHPEWKPGVDWEQDVGCVYWEAPDAVVLVDPLVPGEPSDREHFLASLDEDVERAGRPVAILLTCAWHARSSAALAERFDTWVMMPFAAVELPRGVEAVVARVAEEVVFWLPGARTVVPGDTLLGVNDGLQLCPESWLESRGSHADLRDELAPLLELPVERILTTHGSPVLEGGREALAQALGAA